MAYLSELHPEVYLTSPRPGGLANIVPIKDSTEAGTSTDKTSRGDKSSLAGKGSMSGKSSVAGRSSIRSYKSTGSGRSSVITSFDAKFLASTPETCREVRINHALHASGWMLPELDEDLEISIPGDPFTDVMMILSITISSIMLMAVEYKDLSKDHLRWTLSYLECVKDEFGNFPPNVRAMMNQIQLIDSTIESFHEKELKDDMMDGGASGIIPPEAPADESAAPPADEAPAE